MRAIEIVAAKIYNETNSLDVASNKTRLTSEEVLRAVGEYRRSMRNPHPECKCCSFRTEGRPCVMPLGICGLDLWRRKHV